MINWITYNIDDLAALKAQEFTPTEACYITSISPQRLVSWHDDGFVRDPRDQSGRGHGRRYNIDHLAVLAALRTISERGVPLRDAAKLADDLAGRQIVDAFDEVCGAASVAEAEAAYPMMIAIYDGEDEYLADVFFCGSQVDGTDGMTLYSWFRATGITDAIIVVPMQLAVDLKMKMEEVLARRGTSALRRKLDAYVDSFKRKNQRDK